MLFFDYSAVPINLYVQYTYIKYILVTKYRDTSTVAYSGHIQHSAIEPDKEKCNTWQHSS